MNPSIRSVPDLPIVDLLARAYGVQLTCYSSSSACVLYLNANSSISILVEPDTGDLAVLTRFPTNDGLNTLTDLRDRQRDTEVLVRWAEFVTTYAQHNFSRTDINIVMEIIHAIGIDGSDEDFLRQIGDLAEAREIGVSDDDLEEAVEGFISIALTLRELDAMAATASLELPPIVQIDMPAMSLCGESLHAGV